MTQVSKRKLPSATDFDDLHVSVASGGVHGQWRGREVPTSKVAAEGFRERKVMSGLH